MELEEDLSAKVNQPWIAYIRLDEERRIDHQCANHVKKHPEHHPICVGLIPGSEWVDEPLCNPPHGIRHESP